MRALSELLKFLTEKMSMVAVYQPVIILHLLERDGVASRLELARTLSSYDCPALGFWDKVLMDNPKRWLVGKHQILLYDKVNQNFYLNFELKEAELIAQAKAICEQKIEAWIQKEIISGNLSETEALRQYSVLQNAKDGGKNVQNEQNILLDEFAMRVTIDEVYRLYPNQKITQQSYDRIGFDILVGSIEKPTAYIKVKATESLVPSFFMIEMERRFSIEKADWFLLAIVYGINLQTETCQTKLHRGAMTYTDFYLVPTDWKCKLLVPD